MTTSDDLLIDYGNQLITTTTSVNNQLLTNNLRYVCKQCFKTYAHKNSLVRHCKYECNQPRQFGCPRCSYKARRRENLNCHLLTCKARS